MDLIVRRMVVGEAVLHCGDDRFRAVIGAGGIGVKRSEGDGVTPIGVFPPRLVFYRADRLACPLTGLPVAKIEADDGWCDAPLDPLYNRPVKRPYGASTEALWRDDGLYDLVVVLGFNDAPVVPGAGSAVFLHVARPDFGPTAGCIALALDDLVKVVSALAPDDSITIMP
jgi:L,D-peptidoglycan transpeptidase YkuD (ErfK/YbiS/YcfS/YnhG family)